MLQVWGGKNIRGEEIFPRLKPLFDGRDDLDENDIEASRQLLASFNGAGLFRR